MRPSYYRLKSYRTHQDNFYNGSLPLAYLAGVDDNITVAKIHQEQMSAIKTFHKTLNHINLTQGLNQDILKSAVTNFNSTINENTIVNEINDRLDKLKNDYQMQSPAVSQKAAPTADRVDAAIRQAENLMRQYYQILTIILSNTLYTSDIIGRLEVLNNDLLALEQIVRAYSGGVDEGRLIHSYFWRIFGAFHKLKGFQLEEDIVTSAKNWLPSGFKVVKTGGIYVNGKQSKLDNAIFSDIILDSVIINYQVAPKGSKNKMEKQGTLRQFFEQVTANSRTESYYLTASTYESICRASIANIQAKAMSNKSRTMTFGKNWQLFDSYSYGVISKGKPRVLSSIQLAYKHCATLHMKAICSMRDLYELAKQENPKTKNYKMRADAGKKFLTFINYSLAKMIPEILDNNQFLLSNRFGLITFEDLFLYQTDAYFSWSDRKMLDLNKMENYSLPILLNI